MTTYRGLGLDSLELNKSSIPALSTPYAVGGYSKLKTTDKKISDYMLWGVPRIKIRANDALGPMIQAQDWKIYVRNMFFRPDPYSFWNWPVIVPAEIGVYNIQQETSVAYDITTLDAGFEFLGIENGVDNQSALKSSYWNKTITLDQLSNRDFYDQNKTFISGRVEYADLNNLHQLHLSAFTDGILQVKILNDNNEVVREHKFNTQGKLLSNPAKANTVVQL